MTRIDLVTLQQRLAQQQPTPATPVPAETPSWSTRPAPKARPVIASAAASAGTLRATTTMRAARAEERARAEALRAQIDELNAALVAANAEAARALAQEQARADRLSDRVDAVQRDLESAKADAVAAEQRADAADTDRRVALARLEHAEVARARAEQGKEAERVRADALRDRIEALQAQFEWATHARQEVVDAAEAIRQADDRRLRLSRWARLRAAWTGK